MQTWALVVAQLKLIISDECELFSFAFPEFYQPFLAKEITNVTCEIGLPEINIDRVSPVFSSEKIWAAFQWEKGWGFIYPNTDQQSWQQVILWNPIENHVDIWFRNCTDIRNVFGNLQFPFLAALFAHYHVALSHAAAIKIRGEAWLFIGPGGHGKSTWARICQEHGGEVLDEDRVALRLIDGEVWAFGTPWHFLSRICTPEGAPVRRIFFLRQTEPDTVISASQGHATSRLLKSCLLPIYDPQAMDSLLTLAMQTAAQAETYLLGYANDDQLFARVLLM